VKKPILIFVLIFCIHSNIFAAESPEAKPEIKTSELLLKAQTESAKHYEFAINHHVKILPTPDGKSFSLVWYPKKKAVGHLPMLVTLHGENRWAFDEFFFWQPYAETYGFGIVAVQWRFSGSGKKRDFYKPQEIYQFVDNILRSEKVRAGNVLLHGIGRGSANVFALTALDRIQSNYFFRSIIANAGGHKSLRFNFQIAGGRFGKDIFFGSHWIFFCGGYDKNPSRDGCPAIQSAQAWVHRFGGQTDLFVKDPHGYHDLLYKSPKDVVKAIRMFMDRLDEPIVKRTNRGGNTMPAHTDTKNIYSFSAKTIDGKEKPLSDYKGKPILIVNVASKCGFTPQYEGLEKLYEKYKARGLQILGFPANNFMWQEPGTDAEIKKFCSLKYNVTFDLFSKISVKGKDIHPLYEYLTRESGFDGDISWNFNKFLVDPNGKVVARFDSKTEPLSGELVKQLESILPAK